MLIYQRRCELIIILVLTPSSPQPRARRRAKEMSGVGFLSAGCRRAHHLLLHRPRSPAWGVFPKTCLLPPAARAYVRSRLLSSKLKASSSPGSPLLSSASAAVAASSSARSGFASWYLGMIGTRPILTKCLTAGAIFTAADISSQLITLKSNGSLDLVRTLRMACYGLLISGSSLHCWFNFVSRILPKRDITTTFKKIFLGQAFYGPLMTVIFFSFNAGLQGETSAEILARLKRDLIPTLKSGVVYWPLCDFITFKFVPVTLQPLVSNSFSFLWTIYITYMASLGKARVEKICTV